jgi:hypothetical protein
VIDPSVVAAVLATTVGVVGFVEQRYRQMRSTLTTLKANQQWIIAHSIDEGLAPPDDLPGGRLMPDPWMVLALVESGLILGVLVAPIYAALHEALQSMGSAVEEDVEDDIGGGS